MRKILFVTYGGGHVNIIDEVAQSLLNIEELEFNILALTLAYPKLRGIYPKGIVKNISDFSYLFEDLNEEAIYWGNYLLDENYNINSSITKKETVHYIGYSYVDLILKHGKDRAAEIYHQKKRTSFLPTTIIEEIISKEGFDTIITTTSPRFELASIIAGNKLKKRTIQILDLFGEIQPLPQAKEIITMNKDVTKSLIKQGVVSKFYEYGQPSIEKTVHHVKSVESSVLKNKLRIKKKTILVATQKLVEFTKNMTKGKVVDNKSIYKTLFKDVFKIVKDFNLQLLIRIHPSENLSFYNDFLEGENYILLNNEFNSIESIAISDYVLTHSSTIGVEALACGKTVFTYSHHHGFYPIKQMQKEPFFHSNIIGLEKAIKKVLLCNEKNEKNEIFIPLGSVQKIKELILN